MEVRVAKLESDMAHLVKQVDKIDARTETLLGDVGTLKTGMAVLTNRVDALPTKEYLTEQFGKQLTKIAAWVGIIAALATVVNVILRLVLGK